MSTINGLPGSDTGSPSPENSFVHAGDVHASQQEWLLALAGYDAALEQTGLSTEEQKAILTKATAVFAQYQLQANKEARATIETCDEQLRGKALMRSEEVAFYVEQKAFALMQLREFDEAINICNLSLKGKFKNIPFATRDRIKAIQEEAATAQQLASALIEFSTANT